MKIDLSSVAPVPSSLARTRSLPVVPPGVIVSAATAAPIGAGSWSVTGRPAGAVVATTVTVLPTTPSRLGSPVLTGPVAPMGAGMAGNAGTGVKASAVTPASVTLPDTALSPGVAVRAAVAVNAVPAPGSDPLVAVIRAVRAPTGVMVTPAGWPVSVQVSLPAPAAVALTMTDLPTPTSAGATTAVTVGAVCTTGAPEDPLGALASLGCPGGRFVGAACLLANRAATARLPTIRCKRAARAGSPAPPLRRPLGAAGSADFTAGEARAASPLGIGSCGSIPGRASGRRRGLVLDDAQWDGM